MIIMYHVVISGPQFPRSGAVWTDGNTVHVLFTDVQLSLSNRLGMLYLKPVRGICSKASVWQQGLQLLNHMSKVTWQLRVAWESYSKLDAEGMLQRL